MYAWRELGFKSYEAYLASPLWSGIRERVYNMKGRKCLRCKVKPAEAIHHESGELPTMDGSTLEFLIPICDPCHRIEHKRVVVAAPKKKRKRSTRTRKQRRRIAFEQEQKQYKVQKTAKAKRNRAVSVPLTDKCGVCRYPRFEGTVKNIDGVRICQACLLLVKVMAEKAAAANDAA